MAIRQTGHLGRKTISQFVNFVASGKQTTANINPCYIICKYSN